MGRTSDDNYYEDFEVGQVYEHPRGKTMTEMDNVLITNMVLNTAQGHFNEDSMRDSEFGQRIVYGGINLSLVCGLASETISENAISILQRDPASIGMEERHRLTQVLLEVLDNLWNLRHNIQLNSDEQTHIQHAGGKVQTSVHALITVQQALTRTVRQSAASENVEELF